MKTTPRCLASLIVLGLATGAGADDRFEVEPGFVRLFNGEDLTGWRVGDEVLDGKTSAAGGRFRVEGGAIVVTGAPKILDLYTVRTFPTDFVLRLEFRALPRANSGLHIRGKQLQVRDYPTVGPYKDLERFNAGGWNAIEVVVKGDTAACTCNGEVLEAALKVPADGGVGLQSETNRIEYRRIRVSERPRPGGAGR